jgi:hypothetical protein
MTDNARHRKGPTGGTVAVWIFLLAVAALLVMVIYTFAGTEDGRLPRNKIRFHPEAVTQASSDDHHFLTGR